MQETTLDSTPLTDEQIQSEIEKMLGEMRALNGQIQADRERALHYSQHQQQTMLEVREILAQLRSAS